MRCERVSGSASPYARTSTSEMRTEARLSFKCELTVWRSGSHGRRNRSATSRKPARGVNGDIGPVMLDVVGERPGLHERSVLTRGICKARCSGREAQSAEQRTREATRTGKEPLDLTAPACAIKAPFAEVLTIVRQNAIAAFAETRTRTRQHFATIEAWPVMSNPDAAAVCEMFERNLFHRSAAQYMAGPSVMNDATIADVDTMMAVELACGDEMRAECGFCANMDERVARREPLVAALNGGCIVGSPVHTFLR